MRIEGLESRRASWLLRPIYFVIKRRFGKMLTPYTVWAHRPSAAIGVALAIQGIEPAKVLDARVKRFATLRVAQLVGCPF